MGIFFIKSNSGLVYAIVMVIAAGIAFARSFFYAGILDVPSFGLYVAVLGVGMFSSALLSFGEIEKTFKAFPRLWVEHYYNEITLRTKESTQLLIRRASVIFIIFLPCIYVNEWRFFAQEGMLVILIALSSAVASLYASAIRATGDTDILARNTFFRAGIVVVLGISGAFLFNWQGAIIGEALGNLIGIFITRYSVIQKARLEESRRGEIRQWREAEISRDRGLWLFIAMLLTSVPFYLDRAFVASVFGNQAVGTFGFLMLFVAGANVFTGIVIQKVGPLLIKMEHLGSSVEAQTSYVLRWLRLIWLVCIVGMVFSTLMLMFGPAQYYFEKFHLNLGLIIPTVILCILQVSVMADFIIISRNQEYVIFNLACFYLAVVGIAVLIVLWLKITLVYFVWMLVFAKLAHVVIQAAFIRKLWYGRPMECVR